jgi:hypothetical protein
MTEAPPGSANGASPQAPMPTACAIRGAHANLANLKLGRKQRLIIAL